MDLIGFSKYWSNQQPQILHQLKEIVRYTDEFNRAHLSNQLITRATGDGMALVFFGDPEAPVRCALQIASALKSNTAIKLRMGIHSGLVYHIRNIAGERDIAGKGINFAQRVMDCGDTGHILLSKEAVDIILEFGERKEQLEDLGEVLVKHGMPLHLFNLYTDELGNRERPSKLPTPLSQGSLNKREEQFRAPIDSLAILPLANAGTDPSMEYLSDGITESIINNLSQITQLRVMARNTVFRYKGKDVSAQEVRRELGVRAVMAGRVLQLSDSLIIKTELIDALDGTQLWGEQYRRKSADIFEVQEEISKEISGQLRLKLTGTEKKLLTKRYTDNIEAYHLYLKGRYYCNKRTKEGLIKGTEHFQQAIDVDPNYGLAYAGLADAYALFGLNRLLPPNETLPRARAAAMKALDIDDTLAEAHGSLALVKTIYEWDWAGAEKEFKESLALNPNNALTHSNFSLLLSAMGRHEESLKAIARAQELDPLSLIINSLYGLMYFYNRCYDKTIEQGLKTLDIDPNFFWVFMGLGWCYEQKGMYEEAIAAFQNAVKLTGGGIGTLAALGHAYAISGKRNEAQTILDKLAIEAQQSYISPFDIALVYTGMGEIDHTFKWLEKAYEDRFGWLIWLNVEPKWDSIRLDPRFTDLLRRLSLTP
jgi:TolB-like protein/class 3 adenylate cyclase/Flp pilus assembly protein TadD